MGRGGLERSLTWIDSGYEVRGGGGVDKNDGECETVRRRVRSPISRKTELTYPYLLFIS